MRIASSLFGIAGVLGISLLCFECGGTDPNRTHSAGFGSAGETLTDPPTARRDMLDQLRLAHAATRHSSDGGGRAWLELADGETATVRASGKKRWTIVYEAGPEGIEIGGFLRFTVPRFWDWTSAQASDPDYPGYTTATTDAEGVELEPYVARDFWVEWRIGGRPLAQGERITIVYGAGPRLARADKYAEEDSRFWLSVDGDADGFPGLLVDSPAVTVLAGSPSKLHLILPSTAEPDDEITLHISVLDSLGNAGTEFVGTVELDVIPDALGVKVSVEIGADDAGSVRHRFRFAESGVYRLIGRAEYDGREFVATSNPIIVEAGVAPIRWGDLHGHSNISDGTGTPEQFLRYARDIAGLDIVCLTDHDHWGMLFLDEYPEQWIAIQDVTNRYNDPGHFVSIVGFEWTNWVHGHRHVLYFEDEGRVLSSIDPDYETPAQLWDALRGQRALTFAHHSAGGPIATNWDYPPDPELEPVTEVASVHGNSEAPDAAYRIYSALPGNFVRDALDRGYQLGFIGSADSHDGHPGLAGLSSPAGSGLAALLTDDLTREGVYRTLRERRTYATNGPRIILRAAVDAFPMGATIPPTPDAASSLLYVRVVGTAPLETIEVIKNGEIVDELSIDGAWDVPTTFDLGSLETGDYVYVRVRQSDRGTAWSSPFFVGE